MVREDRELEHVWHPKQGIVPKWGWWLRGVLRPWYLRQWRRMECGKSARSWGPGGVRRLRSAVGANAGDWAKRELVSVDVWALGRASQGQRRATAPPAIGVTKSLLRLRAESVFFLRTSDFLASSHLQLVLRFLPPPCLLRRLSKISLSLRFSLDRLLILR